MTARPLKRKESPGISGEKDSATIVFDRKRRIFNRKSGAMSEIAFSNTFPVVGRGTARAAFEFRGKFVRRAIPQHSGDIGDRQRALHQQCTGGIMTPFLPVLVRRNSHDFRKFFTGELS